MKKYHIKKDGTPGECEAVNKCPLGNPDEHYESRAAAQAAADRKAREEFGLLAAENRQRKGMEFTRGQNEDNLK